MEFLSNYEKVIDNIDYVIINEYYDKNKPICEKISDKIINRINSDFFDSIKKAAKGNRRKALDNLVNSWYHECSLAYPEDTTENIKLNERMMFASWKIIQFYYTIFTSMSAVIRCIHSQKFKDHKAAINFFDNNLLKTNFFDAPFNISLSAEGNFYCPGIEGYNKSNIDCINNCLSTLYNKDKKKINLFHFFKNLREWATYENSRTLIRLYHEKEKRKKTIYIDRLDLNMKRICYAFNTMVELFLINFFGWEDIKIEFESFKEQMENCLLIPPCKSLLERFEFYYKKYGNTK